MKLAVLLIDQKIESDPSEHVSSRFWLLFSYGMQQNGNVLIAYFGRELKVAMMRPWLRPMDSGYFVDPKLVALTAKSHHLTVEPSSNPEEVVSRTVFEITEHELPLRRNVKKSLKTAQDFCYAQVRRGCTSGRDDHNVEHSRN